MRRRSFLKASAVGLVALVGGGAAVWSQVPPIPKRPNPDADAALGWIAHENGQYRLTIPRAEMGQNIVTAMKQIACTELQAEWDAINIELHDTTLPGVKPTVGSESVQLFAEPLAQACASLRDAVKAGRKSGTVSVSERPRSELLSLKKGGFIGKSPRIEQGLEIVTGKALYAADISRPGMHYGRVLRAPASVEVATKPISWNAEAASAVPGFVEIVEDCGPAIGQAAGLGIIASRPGALEQIAAALDVRWSEHELHEFADIDAAIDIDKHLAEGSLPHTVRNDGPNEGSWDVDLRIDIPLAAHAPIEPRSAVAEWKDGHMTIWAGSQDVFYIRDVVVDALGLPKEVVTVQGMRIGGGFGGKTICTVEAEAAALSRAIGKPVKVQWTRAQEFAQAFHRPPSSHRIKVRTEAGRIADWEHNQVSSHIMFTSAVVPEWMQAATDTFAGDGGVKRGLEVPYRIDRARSAYDAVRLPIHTGPWRGLGAGPNALATESAIDEAAWMSGVDPVEFRLNNINDPRLADVLKQVAAIANWRGPSVREGIGRGVACGIYKNASYAAVIADVTLLDGTATVIKMWCVHDCGLVINPDQVRAQCEGNLVWGIGMVLQEALPIDGGRVSAETFADSPIPKIADVPPMVIDLIQGNGPSTGAGETAIVAGPAAIANALRAATGKRPIRFPVQPGTIA